MKKLLLSGALLMLMAVVAEAQIYVQYDRRTRNSSLSITYSGYSYSSYGYGLGGYGFGYDLGYGGYGFGGFGGSYGGGYGNWYYSENGMYSYGSLPGIYGGRGYYGYGPYRYGAPYRPVMDYSPAPAPARGVADRAHEYASAREIEAGRQRFKMGDYRGAVDEFRAAVAAFTDNALAQAYFALGLVVIGDGKNADKALRAVADRAPFKIDLKSAFKDDKERARVTGLLAKVSGDGALAAAYAQFLLGDADRLKALADKDPAAKKLLGN